MGEERRATAGLVGAFSRSGEVAGFEMCAVTDWVVTTLDRVLVVKVFRRSLDGDAGRRFLLDPELSRRDESCVLGSLPSDDSSVDLCTDEEEDIGGVG